MIIILSRVASKSRVARAHGVATGTRAAMPAHNRPRERPPGPAAAARTHRRGNWKWLPSARNGRQVRAPGAHGCLRLGRPGAVRGLASTQIRFARNKSTKRRMPPKFGGGTESCCPCLICFMTPYFVSLLWHFVLELRLQSWHKNIVFTKTRFFSDIMLLISRAPGSNAAGSPHLHSCQHIFYFACALCFPLDLLRQGGLMMHWCVMAFLTHSSMFSCLTYLLLCLISMENTAHRKRKIINTIRIA